MCYIFTFIQFNVFLNFPGDLLFDPRMTYKGAIDCQAFGDFPATFPLLITGWILLRSENILYRWFRFFGIC